jgi:hypothetical protein
MVRLKEPDNWGHTRIVRALKALKRVEIEKNGKRYRIRTEIPTETVEIIRQAGFGIPSRVEVV